RRQPLVTAFGPAILDREIEALAVAKLAQPATERVEQRLRFRGRPAAVEISEPDRARRALRPRRPRKKKRTGRKEQRQPDRPALRVGGHPTASHPPATSSPNGSRTSLRPFPD